MSKKLLPFLLALCVLLNALPITALAEAEGMPEETEALIEAPVEEAGVIDLDDLSDEGDAANAALPSEEEVLLEDEFIVASLEDYPDFTAGYACIAAPENAVYDDDFVLIAENLPVDTIVYVLERDDDGQAHVTYIPAGQAEAVTAWMDAAALLPAEADVVDAAKAQWASGQFVDDEQTLPVPVIEAEGAFEEAADAFIRVQPDKVSFAVSKLNIGLNEVYDRLDVILGSDPDQHYDADLTFSSDKEKYVTVDDDGVLTGVKKGSATITVKTSNGLKATCKVTVKSAPTKVTVSPATLKLNAKEKSTLTAKFNSSSAASAVTWSSDDESVATVDERTGVVTAVAPGKAVITAETFNGKQSSATVTVLAEPTSLTLEDSEITLGVKEKITIAAKLNPGADCPVTYTTSNPKVVSVKGNVLTAAAQGQATITASTYNGLKATCDITVEPAPKSVKLDIKTLSIGEGDTYQCKPIVDGLSKGLTYTVGSKKYVTVDEDGLITAVKAGSTYVTIKTYNGKSFRLKVTVQKAPTSVKISPAKLNVGVGQSEKINCVVPSGSYASVTLTSSNPSIAAVDDETGEVIGVKVGTATITAETYNGLTATCTVTVDPAPDEVVLDEDDIELAIKDTYQLDAWIANGAKSAITFTSEDTKVATVSSTGLITAKTAGETVIRAQSYLPDVYAEAYVTVWGAPTKVTLPFSKISMVVDESLTLEPEIPDNTRTTFTFKTSNKKVADIDEDGELTAIGLGTATITVTTHNGKSAKLTVVVSDPYYPESIELLEDVPTLEVDDGWQVDYEIWPETAETELKWSTSDKKIATVDQDGYITAVGKGTATITAVSDKNSKCKLTIKVKVTAPGGGGYGYDGELVTEIPVRITDIDEIDENLEKIYAIRDCALAEIARLEDEGEISGSDASTRSTIVENIFENYAFPWMTLHYQDYWKEANSEGGVKDFKPGNVYYGLPYISGSGDNRHYNVELALAEDRYYDSGEGYYILNQNRLLKGKYVGNDCSGLVDVSIWGTDNKHSDDRTDDIASKSNSAYKTISDFKAMRPGDLICKGGSHVVMFLYYVNDAKTRFMMIENGGAEAGTNTVHCDIYDASYYTSRSYKVRRLSSLG